MDHYYEPEHFHRKCDVARLASPTCYDFWTTRDGRKVAVVGMENLHLLHTVRFLESGRSQLDAQENECWLIALKAECLRRQLDWRRPPSRRVNLIDFAASEAIRQGDDPECADAVEPVRRLLCLALARHQIAVPEVDVDHATGRVTYLHWQAGDKVGTPVTQPPGVRT